MIGVLLIATVDGAAKGTHLFETKSEETNLGQAQWELWPGVVHRFVFL